MITVSDITITLGVNNETYHFDLALVYTGTRSSVYGEMYQYYMPTTGSQLIPISGQDLQTDVIWESIANDSDGFFRFIFLQAEVYNASATYVLGDLIYNVSQSRFEKCTTAIPVAKPYDSADWTVASPEDSGINAAFKSTKDTLVDQRAQKTLLNLREGSINEFIDSGFSEYKYSELTKLKKTESLYQAARDNFDQLDNKNLAQKYIEYIEIIN